MRVKEIVNCKNCKFFDDELYQEEELQGECKRYPPSKRFFEDMDDTYIWLYPEVNTYNWCGEFAPSNP